MFKLFSVRMLSFFFFNLDDAGDADEAVAFGEVDELDPLGGAANDADVLNR